MAQKCSTCAKKAICWFVFGAVWVVFSWLLLITKKAIFWFVFGAVWVVFSLRGLLLITRYGITGWNKCNFNDKSSNSTNSEADIRHDFIFTTVVYAILSVLRLLEFILLGKQFYHFFFEQKDTDSRVFFRANSKRFYYLPVILLILAPYILLGFAIPGLGIFQEIKYSESRSLECSRHYHEIYITYCAFNFLRYLSAYIVRALMIYATLYLSKIWPLDDSPCERTVKQTQNSSSKHTEPTVEQTQDSPPELTEEQALADWNLVSKDWKLYDKNYTEIGKKVEAIQELFQTWFIVPWIIYLVATSLKTYNILRPWRADSDGDTPIADIPQIFYLLYNLNQFITLLIPYLCARKMNTYHQEFFNKLRENQLKKFQDNPNRSTLARRLEVEWEEDFDFLPRIPGINIPISLGNPLYVILLLSGIFFSISESLLSTK